MSIKRFTLTKEIGNLLAKIRKEARLTQKDVAERLGLSEKAGKMYISKLEQGNIKNPSMNTILHYLTVCNKPWVSFFEKLAGIYFMKSHWKIISQVDIPRHYKKVTRDVAKYQHSIETKFSEKQGLKPLKQEKQEKMAIGFLKHRVVIEPIEREVQKLLGELNAPLISNQFYKAFARECYSALKKITTKARNAKRRWSKATSNEENSKEISVVSASSALNIKLNQIIEKWVQKGLERNILEKVKEIPIKHFQNMTTDEH